MKLLTLYGKETRLDKALALFLKKRNYSCTRAHCLDEIDQLGKQRNKIFLIFNDYEKAIATIKALPITDFKLNSLLFISSELKLTQEQLKMLDIYSIPVFNDNELKKFIVYIDEILNQKDSERDSEELEFTAQKQSG